MIHAPPRLCGHPIGHGQRSAIMGLPLKTGRPFRSFWRRRSAVEPVIGHAKNEHRMDRNFLKGTHGDATNAILAAAGYNFRRLLA